jgi:multiple sugar transport system permease protein
MTVTSTATDSTGVVPPSTRAPRASERSRGRRVGAFALVLPAVAWLTLVVVVPAVIVVVLALFRYDPLRGTSEFVGLENFRRLLENGSLRRATLQTLLYTVMTVPVILGLGLGFALAIHHVSRGASWWRTVFFLPVASTLAGMSVVWRWMFYPRSGIVDSTIGSVTSLEDWLNSSSLALPAVAVVGCWQGLGAAVIMFLAGLAGVPQQLVEAATVDGARRWSLFWHVTWPALGPATVFALVVTTRDALRVFDQVSVMTGGGPSGQSETLAFLMWRRGIFYSDIGGASVINIVLLAFVLVTIGAQMRLVGRRWEQAGSR